MRFIINSLILVALGAAPIAAQQRPLLDELELDSEGGIEAPTQPSQNSRASVSKEERFEPDVMLRNTGRLRTRIGSMMAVRGQEDNHVMGIGLVTGLAGTGDSGDSAKMLLQNLLRTRNINLDIQALSSDNIAVVRVEALLSSGIKPGRRIDVRVSTLGDAESLQGGTLTMTELTDVTGTTVYATCSGPLAIGGFAAQGDGATVTRNHVTVGTLPGGGKIEREIVTRIVSDHGYVYLDARVGHDSFGNVVRIVDAINDLYPAAAEASPDGKTVKVRVPADLPETMHLAYVSSLLALEVESENLARIVINERSGIIVMGGDVRLRPGAVAQGNLTVTIAETPEASQPGAFTGGSTQIVPRTDLDVVEGNGALIPISGAVTLSEVVEVLNALGTTPRDLISILQAMSQGGLLVAEIHRM